MTRTQVRSSTITSIGFEPYADNVGALDVEFRSGVIYRYLDVPPALHATLMAASSKGKAFATLIKAGGYRYARMSDPEAANARLVAAAPDLLDLARGIVTAFGDLVLPSHVEKHLLDGARAAIAKTEDQ